MEDCVDVWSISHFISGALFGVFIRSCCTSCTRVVRYAVVFVIMVLWEVFELLGREWEWSEPQMWWEYETVCNRIFDIVIALLAFALVDCNWSDRRYEEV